MVKTLFKIHKIRDLLMAYTDSKVEILKEYPLNRVQQMVLFLAMNNYSYSEISDLLTKFGYRITPFRINDYLEQLKLIFHVRNKTQLIEKTIGLNFNTLLPEGLFNKLSSVEITDEEAKIISEKYTNKNNLKL